MSEGRETLGRMASPDDVLTELAVRQHGAFTVGQARAAGFTERQIEGRVAHGTWVRLLRGVLAIAGTAPTWRRAAVAPLLARPDAALVERSAGHVHGLVDAPLLRPALRVPRGTSTRVPGAGVVHRWPIEPDELTVVDGLRVTTGARTVADLAGILPSTKVGPLVDDAIHRRLATPTAIDLAAAAATHLTSAQREALLAATAIWQGIRPGSAGEARLLRQLREWGIEEPERQVPILDPSGQTIARADLGWVRARFGLEYDSDEFHGPSRWAIDEARHLAVVAAGWSLAHVGGRDLLPSSDLRTRVERHLRRLAA